MGPELVYGIAITAIPLLMSLTIHEYAHARTAQAFGDQTAKANGRCTLNPLAHLDPMGTICMLVAGFGWARPVPVNPNYLDPPRLGNVAVSAAGPASNLGLAAICGIVLRVLAYQGVALDTDGPFKGIDLVAFLLTYALIINLNLLIFNLIPLFPLDGHHIGRETLSARMRQAYMAWQVRFGPGVLMVLMVLPVLLRGTAIGWFNPLGWYIGHVLWPMFGWLLGPNGSSIAFDSLIKFHAYLPWLS